MVTVEYSKKFEDFVKKIKDNLIKEKVKKQIIKIINFPETGKPMRYVRKDTREVYVGSFRLSYSYVQSENKIIFLELYHQKNNVAPYLSRRSL